MAYSTSIHRACVWSKGCDKSATVEVFNNRNGSIGSFCLQHGTVMVEKLNVIEKEDRERYDLR